MARDRQRSKARQRARAAGPKQGKRSRARDETGLDDPGIEQAGLTNTTPDELEGATPYVDEARAAETGAAVPPPRDDDDYDDFERGEDEVEVPPDLIGAGGGGSRRGGGGGLETTEDYPVGEPKERGRVLSFLRACVDELRRVQWPDRKHVFQATAVVLGFCLIAGLFLGAMDAIWQPLIEGIL